ncbi:hypothetical protein CBLAS_0861 [Campylobacter blaseri]|uniref:Uncharacterized protein n=1 Tax=Campylobacter blaseri TaxID=2042961 RepID=A0A2P8R2L9_9BACT|nr:CtkA family protein [Campylobacter blaseri]PSM52741.1 hypothetical protein CQ405_03160 [Campylobacter blaseri]PSM54389.1 hypothetical protein CRN67_03160 [Campylobacter blaseri]QKF86046.1 hypothetical protein CBLAS_0861 [Campylobacter blaseri]
MIDFTNCEINKFRQYGGANGSKIGIIYNEENYMLKFPPKPTKNFDLSYTNSCFSEYISCHIVNSIGLEAQETLLGSYKDKIVVACKDFVIDDFKLNDFTSLKNSVIDSKTGGKDTTLSEVLYGIENQQIINSDELKKVF